MLLKNVGSRPRLKHSGVTFLRGNDDLLPSSEFPGRPAAPTARLALFFIYAMVVAIVMNAMNSTLSPLTLSPLSTRYEIAGVFVRILRIPGTLACPGFSR